MRKIKIIYGTTAISVLCLLVSLVVSDMGSLLAYILMNVFMFMIGVTALLAGLFLNKDKNGKHDIKFLTITIIISLIFLFIGGRNLVFGVRDLVNEPQEIYLEKCEVTQTKSLRRMFASYYIEGFNEEGNRVRYIIDRDTYYEYERITNFSLNIIGWKESGVIKEIISCP